MTDYITFLLHRIRERLWIKPLAICLLSILGVFLAKTADGAGFEKLVPEISLSSLKTLLTIMSTSMLVIATFAVGSMVSSYASVSSTATPRAFRLAVADDRSQNALSSFIGAFIFSIVSLIALENGYFDKAGRFALFALTLFVFSVVVFTFVRWVDSIARLGRMGTTIAKVEAASADALTARREAPTIGALKAAPVGDQDAPVYGDQIGHVQRIDIRQLQAYAETAEIRIRVAALPGTFVEPGRPIAHVRAGLADGTQFDPDRIAEAFLIGRERTFEEDPRFGLVVLSEIAGKALSPAINDPGTAIQIVGALVRLLAPWAQFPPGCEESGECGNDRIEVPELSVDDMFDDAFTVIGRDGAGAVEVAGRLQKGLHSLASIGDESMTKAAVRHSRLAFSRSEREMKAEEDRDTIRRLAAVGDRDWV